MSFIKCQHLQLLNGDSKKCGMITKLVANGKRKSFKLLKGDQYYIYNKLEALDNLTKRQQEELEDYLINEGPPINMYHISSNFPSRD